MNGGMLVRQHEQTQGMERSIKSKRQMQHQQTAPQQQNMRSIQIQQMQNQVTTGGGTTGMADDFRPLLGGNNLAPSVAALFNAFSSPTLSSGSHNISSNQPPAPSSFSIRSNADNGWSNSTSHAQQSFGAPGQSAMATDLNGSSVSPVTGGFGLFGGKRLGQSPAMNVAQGSSQFDFSVESLSETVSSMAKKPEADGSNGRRNSEGESMANFIVSSLFDAIDDEDNVVSTSKSVPTKVHAKDDDVAAKDSKMTQPPKRERFPSRGGEERPPVHPLLKYATLEATPAAAGPEDKVTVKWELPEELVARGDWIGIYRIHQRAYQSCMTSRYVSENQKSSGRHVKQKQDNSVDNGRVIQDDEGTYIRFIGGTIVFHAPPAIGRYDFRLYQQAVADKRDTGKSTKGNKHGQRPEKKADVGDGGEPVKEPLPLLRSNVLTVEAQGLAFVSSLRFLKKRLEQALGHSKPEEVSRDYIGSLNQLVRLLEQLRDDGPGRPLSYARELWPTVLLCLKKSFKVPESVQGGYIDDDGSLSKDISAADRDRFSLHKTTQDILVICKINPTASRLLKPEERDLVDEQYEKYWGGRVTNLMTSFDPAIEVPARWAECAPKSIPADRVNCISALCRKESAKMMPSRAFEQVRFEIRSRLEGILGQLPGKEGLRLGIFGSSLNNFGSEKSDLDMCLELTSEGEHAMTVEEQRAIIIELAEILPAHGMKEIDTVRVTARIPIIQFVDVKTGIECDVCVNNPLALRNTALLRSYSLADIRVRQIAYMVKKWSKCRGINDPACSTLSSYGYVLTVVHSLQVGGWRPYGSTEASYSPLLPYLQTKGDSWDGSAGNSRRDQKLSKIMVRTTSGDDVDSYFYDASIDKSRLGVLRKFASRCDCPVGRLLLEYFWHFAFVFQWRREVVNTARPGIVLKHSKARDCGWKRDSRLSIEDPFEASYNVAHVLRVSTNKRTRNEYVRAYSILAGLGKYKNMSAKDAFETLFDVYVDEPSEEADNDQDVGDETPKKRQ